MEVSDHVHYPVALSWGKGPVIRLRGGWPGPWAKVDMKKETVPLVGIKLQFPSHPTCSLITTLTELPQLQ
jgi:hypothetical protein